MRKHIFYNTVNFQPVTFRILFFRGIQTLQMRLSRKTCFWWTQLLRPFCRAADAASSLVDYAYAQRLCALQSCIARSVTMERRSFARTLLWRNNHIHDDTLPAVYRKFLHTNTGCIFILNTVSIDNKWNHSHGKWNEFAMSTQNAWYE